MVERRGAMRQAVFAWHGRLARVSHGRPGRGVTHVDNGIKTRARRP